MLLEVQNLQQWVKLANMPFAKESDAKEFSKKFGGKVMKFDEF